MWQPPALMLGVVVARPRCSRRTTRSAGLPRRAGRQAGQKRARATWPALPATSNTTNIRTLPTSPNRLAASATKASRRTTTAESTVRPPRTATAPRPIAAYAMVPRTNCCGPNRRISARKVPETCGMCHSDVADQFRSQRSRAGAGKGITQAPICTDCHGEHSILAPSNRASTVYAGNIRDTCGNCHGNVQLSRRFGLPADRVVSFDASFHGLAAKEGNETVANCASCHGVHNILAVIRSAIHDQSQESGDNLRQVPRRAPESVLRSARCTWRKAARNRPPCAGCGSSICSDSADHRADVAA